MKHLNDRNQNFEHRFNSPYHTGIKTISGYYYDLLQSGASRTSVLSWYKSTTGVTITNLSNNETYLRKVKAGDNLENRSERSTWRIFDTEYNSDLRIEKTTDKTSYYTWETIYYTINFGNSWATTAEDIIVNDTQLSWLNYSWYNFTGPITHNFRSWANASWWFDFQRSGFDLAPDETGKIELHLTIPSNISGVFVNNSVSITGTVLYENNTNNNSDEISNYIHKNLRLYFTWLTPDNGKVLDNNSLTVEVDWITDQIKNFDRTRSGVEYNIYNTWVLLRENFDNISELWESENTIKDISNNWFTSTGHNTELSNTSRNGKSYFFDGIDGTPDYMELLDSTNAENITGDFSISIRFQRIWLWNYYSSYKTGARLISRDKDQHRSIMVGQKADKDNIWNIKIYYEKWNYKEYEDKIDSNYRYNFVWIRDYANNETKFYLNNNLLGTWALSTASTEERPIFLWAQNSNWDNWFIWYIDEPRIFNYALDETWINMLYKTNLAQTETEKRSFFSTNDTLGELLYEYQACGVNALDDIGCTEIRNVRINKYNNLNITKTSNTWIAQFGDDISYTLTIENNEDFTGTTMKVRDYLDTGLQFQTQTSTNLTPINFYSWNTSSWFYLERSWFQLAPWASWSITFTSTIIDSFVDNFIISGNWLSGYAYNLDGNDDLINLGNSNDFNPWNDDIFISAFIKYDNINTERQMIFARNGSENWTRQCYMNLYITTYGKLHRSIRQNDKTLQSIESNMTLETWHRYRIWAGRDIENDTYELFVNNTEHKTAELTIDWIMTDRWSSNGYIWNAAHWDSNIDFRDRRFDGEIRWLSYYNEFPTESQIQNLRDNMIVTSWLKAFYKADETNWTTAYDSYWSNNWILVNWVSHLSNNEYSYHTYLWRTDGNGSNWADTWVRIPRDEINTGEDVLWNPLWYNWYFTNGIYNIWHLYANNNDIEDDSSVTISYTVMNDLRITKSITWDIYSGGVVSFDIQYWNSWSDAGIDVIITETLGTWLSWIDLWAIRTYEWWQTYTSEIWTIEPWTTWSLVLTATILTWAEWWITLYNTVEIAWTHSDSNTWDNTYTTWFDTLDVLPPWIYFTGSTPASGTISHIPTFTGQVEIIEKYLSWFFWNRNGTEYILSINEHRNIFDIWNYSRTNYEETGLVLAMNFDNLTWFWENAWTVADLSQNWNTWTVHNDTTRTDNWKYNGAYEFDGINDYIDMGSDISITPTDQITFGGYFYIKDISSKQGLIGKHFSSNKWYYLTIVQSYVRWIIWDGSNDFYYNLNFPTTKLEQNWRNHIYVTYDWTIGYIYLNGIEQDRYEKTTTIDYSETRPLKIWTRDTANNDFFSWKVDDIRIYNRALSSWEIRQLYSTNITKLPEEKRWFDLLQGNLNDGTYEYQACAEDQSWLTGCTETRNYTVQTPKTITIKTANPYMSTGDFRLFEQTGTESWRQIFNSSKITTDIPIDITYWSENSSGQSIITGQLFPNSGEIYLAAFKLSWALTVGFTGIWNNNITGFNFTNTNNQYLWPKLNYLNKNYLIIWDVNTNWEWAYDLIYWSDLSLLNTYLTRFSTISKQIYDFDNNNYDTAIEQAMILNAIDLGWYLQDSYLPAWLTKTDFKNF